MNLSKFNIAHFLKQLDLASKNHIAFSKFVQEVEILLTVEGINNFDKNINYLRKIWFDLETVNALALDEWESEGKPDNWLFQWNSRYKKDAEEVLNKLQLIIAEL